MLKVILIDDEPSAIQALTNTLSNMDDINIIGSYTDSEQGVKAIKELNPDIVFLDIEMPQFNGLKVAKLTENEDYRLVYVTAYPEHAISAFDTDVTDYLLKPVRPQRLIKCIEKITKRINASSENGPSITIQDGTTTYNVNCSYINVVESLGRYQQIQFTPEGSKALGQENIIVEKSIAAFEEELPHPDFLRVHRGFIVRVDKIGQISTIGRNKYIRVKNHPNDIPVSRAKFKSLLEVYEQANPG